MKQNNLTQKNRWAGVAVGFYILIFLCDKYFAIGSVPYRFETGVAYPAIFVLSGYLMQCDIDWIHFRKRAVQEFLLLFVPSYIFFFLIKVYQYAMLNWGSVDYWWKYVREAGYSIYYSSARDLGDIGKFGPVWMLVVLFFSRQIVNAIAVITHNICIKQVRHRNNRISREESLQWGTCTAIGIAGLILMKQYILLPLNLNTAMLATLLITLGIIWRRLAGTIPARRLIVVMAVSGVASFAGIVTNHYMDLVGLSYPGLTGGLVLSLFAVFFFSNLIKYLAYIPGLASFLRLISKHFILLTLIAEISEIYSILWSTDFKIWSTIILGITILALTELILQVGNIIFPGRKWTRNDKSIALKWRKLFDVLLYISEGTLFLTETLGYASLRKIIPDNVQTALIMTAVSTLLLIYAFRMPRFENNKVHIFMISIIGIALYYAIWKHDVNSQYCLYIFVAAAIGTDIFVMGKLICTISLCVIISLYYLCMNGYIPYEVTTLSVTSSLAGHLFGFGHKNIASGYLLTSMIAYCMSRKSNNRLWLILDTAFIGFFAFINYRYIGGRTEFVLMVLLLVGTILYRLIGKEPLKNKTFYTITKWTHYIIGIPIYVIIIALSIIISWTYNGTHAMFQEVISKFTDPATYTYRLWLNKTALMVYKPKIWGQYIYENYSTQGDYFFIDSSYIKLLLMDGIIFTIIFLMIATLTQYVNAKEGRFYYVFLGTIVALSGIMERQMLNLVFNLIFLSLCCLQNYNYSDSETRRISNSNMELT